MADVRSSVRRATREVLTGRVRWWNVDRGWGFAAVESHPDVFVHHAALADDGDLQSGDMIVFQVAAGTLGPVAVKARRSEPSSAPPSG